MTDAWCTTGSTIGLLRVRMPEAESSTAARCGALMRPLDLEPAGMSPEGILCVRSLHDPLPGAVDVRRSACQRPLAWEAAARLALGEALRRAARPVSDIVAPSADAVYFANRAELLAAAARAACRGLLTDQWWWEPLLCDRSLAGLFALWRSNPTSIPAALERFAAIDPVAFRRFLREIPAAEALRLLEGVCRAFGVPGLAASIVALLRDGVARHAPPLTVTPTRHSADAASISGGIDSKPRQAVPPPAPWRSAVAIEREAADVEVASLAFAAISLELRAAPAVVRAAPFQAAAVAHLTEIRDQRLARHEARTTASQDCSEDFASRSTSAQPERPRDAHPALRGAQGARPQAPAVSVATAGSAEARSFAEGDSLNDVPRVSDTHLTHQSVRPPEPLARQSRTRDSRATAWPTLPSEPIAHSFDEPDAEMWIASGFAGLFFLINVADNLELYSVGITEREDAALPIWDFLRSAGTDIAGKDFENDPLCLYLERLAAEARGKPPHPAFAGDLAPERECDVEEVLRRVKEHIESLMNVDHPAALLVGQAGCIHRTPTHLNVHFTLARHPIGIRAVRLDRNPGWVPGAGLHVVFFFD